MTAERAATLPTRRSAVTRQRPAARPATREADAAGVLVSDTFAAEAVRALRVAMGPSAEFRDQQLEAIRELVQHRKRVLVVQRTGWGKSAVYFVATKLLRDRHAGMTIIISPLLALMRDQVDAAKRLGLKAETINSSNTEDWPRIENEAIAGRVDILIISPERLNNEEFRVKMLEPLASKTGLLVIDEAHCISDWGHDFRPDYRRIVTVLGAMSSDIPVLCTTATANERVRADIIEQLGGDLTKFSGTLDRESLALHCVRVDSVAERLAWLVSNVPKMTGSGIVYCLTIADTYLVADWLRQNGMDAVPYSGETSPEMRLTIEERLKANDVKVVAATSALGMGFDKPDLGFVIHFQSPDSPVGYYQQVGRAGRNISKADAVLLHGGRDGAIWRYFLESSLPIQWQAEDVVQLLSRTGTWLSQRQIEGNVNIASGRLTGLLKILEVEGAVEKEGRNYRRTVKPWRFPRERFARVRAERLKEQQLMRDFVAASQCRMTFLRSVLDDTDLVAEAKCRRCDNCAGSRYATVADPIITTRARAFVGRRPVVIEPRKRWVAPRSGKINQPLQTGRTLCYSFDTEWGTEVLAAQRADEPSCSLIDAAADLISGWLAGAKPTIVHVPAADRSLASKLAAGLAGRLSLPISECVVRTRQGEDQSAMRNSAQKITNLDNAFRIAGRVPAGPILLVDDIVDSRWTLTIVGELLQNAGCGMVYPFALAREQG